MEPDKQNIPPTVQFGLIAFALIVLVVASTIFFHQVEGWSLLNSYYFTIITIATVGYGDFTPKTDVGKIGATVIIILGIGLFSAFVTRLLKRRAIKTIAKEEEKEEEKIAQSKIL